MAYNQPFYPQQPYLYQDQLNQLRSANPMVPQMQGYQMPMNRPDPSGLNWVQGEAGAKSWFVTPGSTVLLMDSESMRFYLKSADMNGVPSLRTFEYNEVGTQKPQETAHPVNYVTVDVFDGFRSEVMKRLDDLSEPVEVSVSRRGRKDIGADEQ